MCVIYIYVYIALQECTLMPPKRETVAATHQPPVKMMKIDAEPQDFVCDPLEDKYRLSDCPSYSPFANQEVNALFSLSTKCFFFPV